MRAILLISIFFVSVFAANSSLRAESESRKEARTDALDCLEITAVSVGNGRLSFLVKNRSSAALKVVRDYMPWHSVSVLRLIAVPLGKKAALIEAARPIEDPSAAILEIPADTEIRGEMNVAPYFPQWNELRKEGFLLVWSFSLYDVETGRDRRFSGVIEYPRR